MTGQHFDKMEGKTRLLLKHYYQALGLTLSDEMLMDFCHVICGRAVKPQVFERSERVYRRAYEVYSKEFGDEFFAFKEKWVKFCMVNHKPAECYSSIPGDSFEKGVF